MTRRTLEFPGTVAVITGAGQGIGRCLAVELARRGARLALCDVDAAALAETCQLTGLDAELCMTSVVDVADRAAVHPWADEVAARLGPAELVINNAGVAGGIGEVHNTDMQEMDWVLGVNLLGTIVVTKAFLPQLRSTRGRLANVSSLNGFAAQAGIAPYCTSKFAVRGFTEAVRAEEEADRSGVTVSLIHPGGIATGIADNAMTAAANFGVTTTARHRKRREVYNKRLLTMPPERAAQIICDGLALGRRRILVGTDARLLDALVRLAPALYPSLMATFERRYLR